METPYVGEYPALFKTLAFIWASGVFVGRGMMALQGMDVPNTGFLPVLIGFWEWFYVFDDEWIRFYVDREVNASGPCLLFCARERKDPNRLSRAKRSLKLQWIERTGASIWVHLWSTNRYHTASKVNCGQSCTNTHVLEFIWRERRWNFISSRERGKGEDTIGGQGVADQVHLAPSLHKAQICVRCWMALARVMTVLEWKFMYKFKPETATEPESGTYNGAIRKRLPNKNFPAGWRPV